jgi:hypothetical protein
MQSLFTGLVYFLSFRNIILSTFEVCSGVAVYKYIHEADRFIWFLEIKIIRIYLNFDSPRKKKILSVLKAIVKCKPKLHNSKKGENTVKNKFVNHSE